LLFPLILREETRITLDFYLFQIQKLYQPLTAQLLDLRSATAKEAGKTI